MNCWIDDASATGAYTSRRWFHVTTQNGVRGFVHSSWVKNQTSVGSCQSHNGVAPARWAAIQVGETKPSSAEASALGINDGMWSGWCQAFASGSFKMTGFGSIWGYKTASNYYREYARRGLVQTNISNAAINIGSLVYYSTSIAGGSGHVAVYVGNGYVVSTIGNGDPTKKISRVPLKGPNGDWGTPIGWVKPVNVDGS
jgi:hypothetical protein